MTNIVFRKMVKRARLRCWSFALIMCVGGIVCTFALRTPVLPVIMGTLGLYSLLFIALPMLKKQHCCIHPYFTSRLPKPGAATGFSGELIAAHIDEIDMWLIQNNSQAMSSFGYDDSMVNSEIKWHDPDVGIELIDCIIVNCQEQWMDSALNIELNKIKEALLIARESGNQFCLHMRWLCGVSGMEFDQREGSYF